MPLIKEKTYTVDDIYALPEAERAELIDGQIYYYGTIHEKASGCFDGAFESDKGLCSFERWAV